MEIIDDYDKEFAALLRGKISIIFNYKILLIINRN